MAPDIILATINARYPHASIALRYLLANLAELAPRAELLEFTLRQPPELMADTLLSRKPKIIALGVYIWNSAATTRLVRLLKQASPETLLVLGGPEVSHEATAHPAYEAADVVIQGEAEQLFHEVCRNFLEGSRRPATKLISGPPPSISELALPYRLYSDEDIRNRVIYVEASRGCPFRCEYCLSSLDNSVRTFPLEPFLLEIDILISRGVRRFKFLDRTFNLKTSTSLAILEFFFKRIHLGLFLHFEMIPDRLPLELKEILRRFPTGSLQLEIGVQTFDPEVAARVQRKQDFNLLRENFRFLIEETQAHLHADLIAGLPGETLSSIASGFDTLSALGPQEIQLGILKRLPGTPIARHTAKWEMVYEDTAPYALLSSKTLDAPTVKKLKNLSKFWDRIANSGKFPRSLKLLRSIARERPDRSLFHLFLELSDFLFSRHSRAHGIPLQDLAESLLGYFVEALHVPLNDAASVVREDYTEQGRRPVPRFLGPALQIPSETPRKA